MPVLGPLFRHVALAAIALLLGAPARAEEYFKLGVFEAGQPCTQLSQIACWRDFVSNAPKGSAPGAQDWVFLGGDNATQAAGRSDRYLWLGVVWMPSFLGTASFPSYFTQRGEMRSQVLSVEEGRYTLAEGLGIFGVVHVGYDPFQGQRLDGVLRTPVLEILGGRLTTSLEMRVGNDAFNLNTRSSGELRLIGGTLDAPGGLRGAGLQAQRVTSTLVLDGGVLNTPAIRDFTHLQVGSTSGRLGSLSLVSGQTASAQRLAVGRDGGQGWLEVTGAGSLVSAAEAVIGSGSGSRGVLTLGALGRLEVGTLVLAEGDGSAARLSLLGGGAALSVTRTFALGAGGVADLEALDGAQLTTGDARVGAAATGRGVLRLAGAGTLWQAGAVEVGVGGAGRLAVDEGASLVAASLRLGNQGLLRLGQGSVQAAQLQVDGGALVMVDLFGGEPFAGYGQLLGDGNLQFDGQLQLNFLNGFNPTAGTRFQLFNFTGYGGSLEAARIQVTGFDAAQLDFSQLMVDGSFRVSAVPEPGTVALWALGLAALGRVARRRAHRS